MEAQKIVNLLNSPENEYSKFATKKWDVIDSETQGSYLHYDSIKFLTGLLESSLCDDSDAYILVTGYLAVKRRNAADTVDIKLASATQVVFKNCTPFKDYRTEINETFVDYADFINIAMSAYNFIEYSHNCSDTLGGLWGFKRDEIPNYADVTNDNNAPSFKYKASVINNTEANRTKNGLKIAVPLKYLSNLWRSLEIPLINCKIKLSLNWIEYCVLTTAANASSATFKITDAKLYIPVITLSTEDNAKLTKQLSKGFKRPVYWNKYKVTDNKVVEITDANPEKHIRQLLDSIY